MTGGRWNEGADQEIASRAFREASALGHSWCGVDHVLLALLDPPAPTEAAAVFSNLGLTRASAEQRLRDRWRGAGRKAYGVSPNPAFYSLMGEARGLALASGAEKVTDEHVLLALAYGGRRSMLVDLGIQPEAVVAALADRGQVVPPLLPPELPPPAGPMGPSVYYPAAEHGKVVRAMITQFPPGCFLGLQRLRLEAGLSLHRRRGILQRFGRHPRGGGKRVEGRGNPARHFST